MKRNLIILILFIMFSWTSVDAASVCSYEKQSAISKSSYNVKVTYEEARGMLDPDEYYVPDNEDPETYVVYYDYFKIKILNITEDIYIKLENSANKEVKYIKYEDTNEGAFTLDWKDLSQVTTFNFTIYSSTKTECPNEEFRKGVISTPMLNKNYNNVMCMEIPEFNLCQKYITNNISDKKFLELANNYLTKKNTKKEEKIKKEEQKKNNKKTILIITSSIVIVGGGIAGVIAIKKRRSSVI